MNTNVSMNTNAARTPLDAMGTVALTPISSCACVVTRSSLAPSLLAICLLTASGLFSGRAAANQVLLFYDANSLLGPSRYQAALENRGYPHQVFTTDAAFVQAVQAADPASDVVVVDAIVNYHSFSSVAAFVQSGGRALLQYWNLAGESALAATFQASVAQQLTAPTRVHDWGGSVLYAGISTPLVLTTLASYDYAHGQKLQPTAGGQAVTGFVSSPSANQAALVIGNSGRTIVQGFFIEEIELIEEAVQLAQSELDFLFGSLAPASAPWIITDPQSQTVLAGGSVTLRVQAGGSLPLSYRWEKDGVDVPGATNAYYLLTNAQSGQSGEYGVVVSNVHGAALSGTSLLTVTAGPVPITNILLLVDDGTFSSPYENALTSLSLAYQKFTNQSSFNPAVAAANPAHTLAILDSYNNPFRYSELVGFVKAGGRALLQIWNLTAGTHLADAFNISVAQRNTTILPVYGWGGSDFFAGVGSPLALGPLSPNPSVHGQKLQPTVGGRAVAGFVSSPSANQAAVVIGNSDRTLVNGFMLEEIVSSTEETQLARNQILFFFPLRIDSITRSNATVTLRWTAIPLRSYQVQYKENLSNPSWFDLGSSVTPTSTTASFTDNDADPQRFYRVVRLP